MNEQLLGSGLSRIRVTISVGGKWYAFQLADQLHRRSMLQTIITSYPLFRLRRDKKALPRGKIVSLPWPEAAMRIFYRVPYLRNSASIGYWHAEWFDILACSRISTCDIFVGFTNSCLYSARQAKSLGALLVFERGSSHLAYEQELVEEEYRLFGFTKRFVDPRLLQRALEEYEEADYIVVQSKFIYRSFVAKGYDTRKLVRIPLGVDVDMFRPLPKQDSVFRVLFVGTLHLKKGVQYLLQAFKELQFKNADLVLIGSIAEEIKPFLRRYHGIYRYIAMMPQHELCRYYSHASVLVLPSIEDGFGQVVLEAMACGIPVIVSENTGAGDVIRNGQDGFIVPIRNVEQLKEKLMYLYENEEKRQEIGSCARERSCLFSWDRYGEMVVQNYYRMLRK